VKLSIVRGNMSKYFSFGDKGESCPGILNFFGSKTCEENSMLFLERFAIMNFDGLY
jgi:hypothetical protein